MVIILAGCDGTGKSTCFRRLKQSLEGNFIKESFTDNPSVKSARALFTASKTKENDLTIYDRATVLDDLVYSKVFANRESELTERIGDLLLSNILNDCTIIYFDLDDVELTRRLEERGDEFVTSSQVNKIKKCYKDVFTRYGVKPISIELTGLSEDAVYYLVEDIINEKLKNS